MSLLDGVDIEHDDGGKGEIVGELESVLVKGEKFDWVQSTYPECVVQQPIRVKVIDLGHNVHGSL